MNLPIVIVLGTLVAQRLLLPVNALILLRRHTRKGQINKPPIRRPRNRVFETAHTALAPPLCALSVSAGTITASLSAPWIVSGTTFSLLSPPDPTSSFCCKPPTSLYASIGSVPDAPATHMTSGTFARDASPPLTGLKTALEYRKLHPISPYNAEIWESQLVAHGLLNDYPTLPSSLRFGFNLNLSRIASTQTPPNRPSLLLFREAFDMLLARELLTGRYLGPYTHDQLLSLLGPFQTSPISIIPKSGKPGKY